TGPPPGIPVASEADGPLVTPLAAEGMQDCPMCGSRYPLGQLPAHVEICMLRKGLGGAGHGSSTAANIVAGITTGARGPSARGVATMGRTENGADRAFGSVRAPSAVLASAAAPSVVTSVAAAPAATSALLLGRAPADAAHKVDIQVPPARNFHAMNLKDAKKIMKECGLLVGNDKQEMADMYNRYRSFLQTEKDRCSTKSTKQLLPTFLRQEQQAERARRLPAEAPGWMQALISRQTAKMNAEMAARRKQAAARAAAAALDPGLGRQEHDQGPAVLLSAAEAERAVQRPPQAQELGPGGLQKHIGQHEEPAGREVLHVGAPGPVPVTVPPTTSAGVGVLPDQRGGVAGIGAPVPAPRPGPATPGPGPPTSSPAATRLDPPIVDSVGVRGMLMEVITIDDSEEEEREKLQAAQQGRPQQRVVGHGGGDSAFGASDFCPGLGAGCAVGANACTVGHGAPVWHEAGGEHQRTGGGCSGLGGGGEHGAHMRGELLRSDSDGSSSSDEMVDCRRPDDGSGWAKIQALAAYLATPQAVPGHRQDGATAHGSATAAAWAMAGPAPGEVGAAPPPGGLWQQGSHGLDGNSGNLWRGLLLPSQPYCPTAMEEGLTDISNSTGVQRLGI
ncbi:hypothetical protein Vretimale_15957, partial [Volvox reticuliferus]